MEKICNKCGISKTLEEFYKNKNRQDGYDYYCKVCTKKYYEKNKKEHNIRSIKWSKTNIKKSREINKKYHLINKDKNLLRNKIRRRNSPLLKVKDSLRGRLYHALKEINVVKSISSMELLGCSPNDCRLYIEKQFRNPMSWENYGIIWEIDHIKPCSSFDLTDPDQQKQCFHYTNLQPLFITTEIAHNFGYLSEIGNRNKHGNI